MSGTTTPNAFPYPAGGDSVTAYPALGQALAEAIDDHVGLQKSGVVASGTLVANTYKSVAVVFTTPFPAGGPVPNVAASVGGSTSTDLFVQINSITRSGFTVDFKRVTGTAALTCQWQATNVGNW